MSQATGSNNSTLVAIAVVALVVVVGFIAYQNGMFGEKEKADVNIEFEMK